MADETITCRPWGIVNGKEVKLFTLTNKNNQQVDILNYGATIRAFRTPDKNGQVDDVVLGFDDIEGYLVNDKPYFGSTIGRVANRIRYGQFSLDGVKRYVSKNIDDFALHGGTPGWSVKIWESDIQNDTLVLTLLSEDNDAGFPGDVIATVTFKLDNDGSLIMEMKATTTKTTPINLTNHVYFNLAGHGTNSEELYKHSIMMTADRWTITDSTNIPTGELRSVANTVMDLRQPKVIGDVIGQVPTGGYDNNFCLPEVTDKKLMQNPRLVAEVKHPGSGRVLTVLANQPGVQFYTSNNLPVKNSSTPIVGKDNKNYYKHGALCLETQNYPDAVNHKNFPSSILRPGEVYYHIVIYKFGVGI